MIKRIIFDLDNTLIMWKDDYLEALRNTIKEFDVKEDVNLINSLIEEYDDKFEYYDKSLMLNYINERINTKLDMNFLNTFLDKFGFMSEKNEEVIKTLEYLSKKYDIVLLTNWFTDSQIKRLEVAGIRKYFKEIYGGELGMKPNRKAFINACNGYKESECLMIGDNYQKDIIGASDAGLEVIFFNYKKKNNPRNFKEVNKFSELERML